MRSINLLRPLYLLLFAALGWTACSKKSGTSGPLDASPGSRLARYDLKTEDYDVLPVTTFVFSYDANDQVTNVFEKSGQTLIPFALTYTGSKLSQATDNTLGTQNFIYDNNGYLAEVDFTTLTDTGRRTFTYDPNGLLVAVVDSVKKPNRLPALTQYLYTYDAGNNNVVLITQNSLDLEDRPTLVQSNYYTYDNQPNPFTACPWLQDATNLPGGIPALVNKNNIVQTRIVGTIFETSGGSNVPKLDTITNYISSRQYNYSAKGYPVSCQESFQDIQFNYSGNRSFTYDY